MGRTAVVDIDGTLVDTNYHHTLAWYRAFRRHQVVLQLWRIHRHIGMGGDQLVAALAGVQVEQERGDAIREAEKALYDELIEEVQPLAGARDLLVALGERGHAVVLASSAKPEEVEHYLDLLDARELVEAWTTAGDVGRTKPAPDLIQAARAKADGGEAVLIGDSVWDCEAARQAGVPTVGVLSGGFSEQELREAGAVAVFDSVRALRQRLDQTLLA
jgi:HAD superfamily hydrolase (TIGR01509 family)